MKKNSKLLKILFRTVIGFLVAIILSFIAFYIYTLDYYRVDSVAENTVITQTMDDYYIFEPDTIPDKNIGFIFYPGGKVEALAYAPLMKKLSDNGITAILVNMPFNLAVLNINAADDIRNDYNKSGNINKWYIGGHSLGGAMASSYIADAKYKFNGLVLLGAYPINDFDIPLLTIIGSKDKIANDEKVKELESLLIIQGGNHANVGDYGLQKGDGKASITREEQQQITVDAIIDFFTK